MDGQPEKRMAENYEITQAVCILSLIHISEPTRL